MTTSGYKGFVEQMYSLSVFTPPITDSFNPPLP